MTDNTEKDYMLTTFDNPFNPFDDFEIWWKFDHLLGHNCCELLDKKAFTSTVFSDEKNEKIIDEAIGEIISENPTLFRRVFRSDFNKFQ